MTEEQNDRITEEQNNRMTEEKRIRKLNYLPSRSGIEPAPMVEQFGEGRSKADTCALSSNKVVPALSLNEVSKSYNVMLSSDWSFPSKDLFLQGGVLRTLVRPSGFVNLSFS